MAAGRAAAGAPPPRIPSTSPEDGAARAGLRRAVAHLLALQRPDGNWEGEMVWCTMILSQAVIVRRAAGRAFDAAERARIVRHYEVTRTAEGAWGLHPEAAGSVFVTTLAYVALRLLGLGPEDAVTAPARRWLRAQPGGALGNPQWGKFWLALLGLCGWEGVNPIPPELFLLPAAFPAHHRRLYCHTRCIYLAMAYLYGRRFTIPLGPLAEALRRELYDGPYEAIDFAAHRHHVSPADLHVPPGAALRRAAEAVRLYERRPAGRLRRRALDGCLERILSHQRASAYHALSPVNGLLNCLAILSCGADHPDLGPSLEGMEAWRWEDEAEGIRYAGARSHAWDTAFAMQAILALGRESGAAAAEALRRGYLFLRDTQLTAELPRSEYEDRDPAVGGWCFSDGEHRWPVSDCTAEALCAILALHDAPAAAPPSGERIPEDRVWRAAQFILRRQNADGGFGSYERRRGSAWLDRLNPSEMFAACMAERSYLECTASCLAALAHFRAAHPAVRRERIDRAIRRGIRFLRRAQRPDGSFPGFWGINFTYAAFHVTRGLRAAGVPPDDAALVRAGAWLVGAQRPDGAWGEHHSGCLSDRYVAHPEGQAVMTSWALLALLEVLDPGAEPIRRGIAWLLERQAPGGGWPREAVNGVFFRTAMLDYRLYPAYFPTWALARYVASTSGRTDRTSPSARPEAALPGQG